VTADSWLAGGTRPVGPGQAVKMVQATNKLGFDITAAQQRPDEPPLLSVCIATMKRTSEVTRQVEKILALSEGLPVEIVVADASPTRNQLTVSHPRLTILRLAKPGGIDTDYDHAVLVAKGEYCWLLTDDDQVDDDVLVRLLPLLEPPAAKPSLVLIDARVFDPTGSLLQESKLKSGFPNRLDHKAPPAEFGGAAELLTYIGSVVISRAEWLTRRSDKYVGTEFRHVGLILEAPLPKPVIVLTPPAISIRYGVAHWEPRAVKVWTSQWPEVIQNSVKDPGVWPSFYSASLVRQVFSLLQFRGRNLLPRSEVKHVYPTETSSMKRLVFQLVAWCPPVLACTLVLSAARLAGVDDRHLRFDILRARPNH
jgi:glycosyltransferase involved in cell wall biosynthesis